MRANAYFGDLRVATLTDSVGLPARYRAAAGWRRGPSNFLLATSRALNHALTPELVYAARRDGDGLVNLLPPRLKLKGFVAPLATRIIRIQGIACGIPCVRQLTRSSSTRLSAAKLPLIQAIIVMQPSGHRLRFHPATGGKDASLMTWRTR
jgi:hypothetical protein